jgi:Asp-tRNA(Asn)/Glu-tRNA(Gln) amidotransferase A subunit family amidase
MYEMPAGLVKGIEKSVHAPIFFGNYFSLTLLQLIHTIYLGIYPSNVAGILPNYRKSVMKFRRQFLINASSTVAAALVAARGAQAQVTTDAPAGSPPTFGTLPAVGPEVTPATFAEAEKLMQTTMTPEARAMAAASWRTSMASMLERRTGPRTVALADDVAPATVWNPAMGAASVGPSRERFVRTKNAAAPLPASDDDIAFATVTQLSRWIESRKLTSERLTTIYLKRIERFDPKLRCVITVTREHALALARQADKEIAAGKYRGPLHGIPYGVKDLLDTAGIATTWGAEPFRNRVPGADSTVVARLTAAGAVLIAKLSLGALALNDIWFGGQTMNPWLLEEGASGSSAGPGSATAAGLVGFSIGSETGGSIVSPSMRCGVTGLRPTYGRVPRGGAMTLCWSLDKLGPMTRGVEDAMLVLQAISGPDAGDVASVPSKLDFDAAGPVRGLKIGYFPSWMNEAPATDVDRKALEAAKKLGMIPTPVTLPDWPYQSLNVILFAEGAAAFEEIMEDGRINQLREQLPDAWPNLFREARFLSAVDFVQSDRLRRKVAAEMARIFSQVDLLLVPSLRDEMLTISNNTGHPSLTLRTGFVDVSETRSDWAPNPARPPVKLSPPRRVPHGVTLIGRLFDEGTIARVGMALEKEAGVAGQRPPGF